MTKIAVKILGKGLESFYRDELAGLRMMISANPELQALLESIQREKEGGRRKKVASVPLNDLPIPVRKESETVVAPVPEYEWCFKLAVSEEMDFDKFVRCTLIVEGSRKLYEAIYKSSSFLSAEQDKSGGRGSIKDIIGSETSRFVKMLNDAEILNKEWLVRELNYEDRYKESFCQLKEGDYSKSLLRIKPYSFVVIDCKNEKVREKGLIELI